MHTYTHTLSLFYRECHDEADEVNDVLREAFLLSINDGARIPSEINRFIARNLKLALLNAVTL
jgi:DnaJ-domain-containing protein 1